MPAPAVPALSHRHPHLDGSGYFVDLAATDADGLPAFLFPGIGRFGAVVMRRLGHDPEPVEHDALPFLAVWLRTGHWSPRLFPPVEHD